MDAATGKRLKGVEHIAQSITDILTTPIGSRVMRREYGSLIYELLDRPINAALILQIYAAAYIAIRRWEPRVRVEGILASSEDRERLVLDITLLRLDTPVVERTTVAVTVGRT